MINYTDERGLSKSVARRGGSGRGDVPADGGAPERAPRGNDDSPVGRGSDPVSLSSERYVSSGAAAAREVHRLRARIEAGPHGHRALGGLSGRPSLPRVLLRV